MWASHFTLAIHTILVVNYTSVKLAKKHNKNLIILLHESLSNMWPYAAITCRLSLVSLLQASQLSCQVSLNFSLYPSCWILEMLQLIWTSGHGTLESTHSSSAHMESLLLALSTSINLSTLILEVKILNLVKLFILLCIPSFPHLSVP